MYAIFNIHYSQIENKVESEKHVKVRLFTVRTDPTYGVSSNMGWAGVSHLHTVMCFAARNLELRSA